MVGQSAKPRVLLNDNEMHYTRKPDCAKQHSFLCTHHRPSNASHPLPAGGRKAGAGGLSG